MRSFLLSAWFPESVEFPYPRWVPRWLQVVLVVAALTVGSCAGCMTLGFASARYGATDVRALCDFAVPGRPVVEVKRYADERSVSGTDYPSMGERSAHLAYRKGRTACVVDHDGTVATASKAWFTDLSRDRPRSVIRGR
jgi:hypothetical protein